MTSSSGHTKASGDHGVVVDGAGDLGDQRARVAERNARADAVLAVAATEDVREPLAQPALDALGRHDDELFGERVRQGIGQQRAEAVGEEVGALSTMEVKRHRASDYDRPQTLVAVAPPDDQISVFGEVLIGGSEAPSHLLTEVGDPAAQLRNRVIHPLCVC